MTAMTERAQIGSLWRRRRDKTTWRVKQSHRADRVAELVPDGHAPYFGQRKIFVSFTDLRTRFEQL